MRKGLTQEEFEQLDVLATKRALANLKARKSPRRLPTLQDMYPDPVERIEFLYGPKDHPYLRTKPVGFDDDWDEERLQVATNPEYMDRARESYAFQDLIGKEYEGVVFE
jgi:hypothetical protein